MLYIDIIFSIFQSFFDVLPVWWIEVYVYPFRANQAKSVLHADFFFLILFVNFIFANFLNLINHPKLDLTDILSIKYIYYSDFIY